MDRLDRMNSRKNKVVDFPNREQIAAEAAEWIIRLDNDRLLETNELQQLREWLNTSPAHRDELTVLNEFWSDQSLAALPIPLHRLCADAASSKSETDNSEATKSNTAYSGADKTSKESHGGFGGFQWLGTVAATVFCVALISNFIGWGSDTVNVAYSTAVGQQRTLELPDGSKLYLNTNSQVKVDFSEGYRNIKLLQGEVHFEVAKDQSRPFSVYAGRGRVQAVGTAFTVLFQDNQDVDVVVSEGSVSLAVLVENSAPLALSTSTPSSASIDEAKSADLKGSSLVSALSEEYYLAIPVDELGVLEAGQETTILVAHKSVVDAPNQLDSIKQVAEDELVRRGAWRSGLLVFSGASLEEVVKEISRYTTLSIDIVDPELKTVRIGGRFSIESTTALFDALEANFDLKVTRLGYERVEISSVKKIK